MSTMILEEWQNKQPGSAGRVSDKYSVTTKSGSKFLKGSDNKGTADSSTHVCLNFNEGKDCRFNPCRFQHVCSECSKHHGKIHMRLFSSQLKSSASA